MLFVNFYYYFFITIHYCDVSNCIFQCIPNDPGKDISSFLLLDKYVTLCLSNSLPISIGRGGHKHCCVDKMYASQMHGSGFALTTLHIQF